MTLQIPRRKSIAPSRAATSPRPRTTRTLKTLIIDNYDSFTFNLYQYLGELGGNPVVIRNDARTYADIHADNYTHIVLSPGPGSPDDIAYFGVCRDVILDHALSIPVLGVCLGHQGICHYLGGKVIRASHILHGKQSTLTHDGSTLFAGVPNPFPAMRYHSLMAEKKSLPKTLTVTSRADDGTIMAVEHTTRPLYGIQFHPESIGTPAGKTILKNFLTQ